MAASIAALTFAGIVAWLHVTRGDVDPATQGVSHSAVGPSAVSMTLAFVALAFGLLATAYSLAGSRPPLEGTGIALLVLAGLGMAIVATVPVPGANAAPWRGPAHTGGALLYFVTVPSGALLISDAMESDVLVLVARLLALAVALFLLSMAKVPGLFPIRGWLQRVCFVVAVVWVVLVGFQIRPAG
jgi:hypothetical protein